MSKDSEIQLNFASISGKKAEAPVLSISRLTASLHTPVSATVARFQLKNPFDDTNVLYIKDLDFVLNRLQSGQAFEIWDKRI